MFSSLLVMLVRACKQPAVAHVPIDLPLYLQISVLMPVHMHADQCSVSAFRWVLSLSLSLSVFLSLSLSLSLSVSPSPSLYLIHLSFRSHVQCGSLQHLPGDLLVAGGHPGAAGGLLHRRRRSGHGSGARRQLVRQEGQGQGEGQGGRPRACSEESGDGVDARGISIVNKWRL